MWEKVGSCYVHGDIGASVIAYSWGGGHFSLSPSVNGGSSGSISEMTLSNPCICLHAIHWQVKREHRQNMLLPLIDPVTPGWAMTHQLGTTALMYGNI